MSQKKTKFNLFGDSSLLSSQEIEESSKALLTKSLKLEDQKSLYVKSINTLNTLKKELILPEF